MIALQTDQWGSMAQPRFHNMRDQKGQMVTVTRLILCAVVCWGGTPLRRACGAPLEWMGQWSGCAPLCTFGRGRGLSFAGSDGGNRSMCTPLWVPFLWTRTPIGC